MNAREEDRQEIIKREQWLAFRRLTDVEKEAWCKEIHSEKKRKNKSKIFREREINMK